MDRVPYYWNMLKIFDGMQTMKTPWFIAHLVLLGLRYTLPKLSQEYQYSINQLQNITGKRT